MALSATETVAERALAAVGLKVTVIVQVPPAATLDAQVLVCEKSLAFVPAMLTPVTVRTLPPLFVSVTDLAALEVFKGWLPKLSVFDERLTPAGVVVPVPERDTLWGLPEALSAMETEAERTPEAAGLNVTLIVQDVLAATLDPQVLVCEKSLALVPARLMPVTVKLLPPLFVSVTDCAELVVFTV